MSQLITVIFDGKNLKPTTTLDLEINKEYQVEIIDSLNNELELSAQLYTEIYQEDEDIQELTHISCIDYLE